MACLPLEVWDRIIFTVEHDYVRIALMKQVCSLFASYIKSRVVWLRILACAPLLTADRINEMLEQRPRVCNIRIENPAIPIEECWVHKRNWCKMQIHDTFPFKSRRLHYAFINHLYIFDMCCRGARYYNEMLTSFTKPMVFGSYNPARGVVTIDTSERSYEFIPFCYSANTIKIKNFYALDALIHIKTFLKSSQHLKVSLRYNDITDDKLNTFTVIQRTLMCLIPDHANVRIKLRSRTNVEHYVR
jgi:hypothetical protein